MEEEKHIERICRLLKEKGYKGRFKGVDTQNQDISQLLSNYLSANKASTGIAPGLSIWVSTFIDRTWIGSVRTLCLMKMDYSPQQGFDIRTVIVQKMNQANGAMIGRSEQKLKSNADLPLAAIARQRVKEENQFKKNRGQRL